MNRSSISILLISIFFVVLVSFNPAFSPDSFGYINAAKNFNLGCFSDIAVNSECLKPSLNWHPLYPFLLFLISKIGFDYILSIPIQSTLFAISCLFCASSLKKILYKDFPFIIIYLSFLICPMTVQWHRWMLMDSFTTSCSLIFIGFAAEIIRKRNLISFILFVLTLIVGYHFKITFLAFIFALLILTIKRFPLNNFSKIKSLITILLVLCVSLTPIQIRHLYLWDEPLFKRFPTNNKAYAPGYYKWLKTHVLSESDMVLYLNPLLSDNLDRILDYPNSEPFINSHIDKENLLAAKNIISNREKKSKLYLSELDDSKFSNLSSQILEKKNKIINSAFLNFERAYIFLADPPHEWQFRKAIEDSGLAAIIRSNKLLSLKGMKTFISVDKIYAFKLCFRYFKHTYRIIILSLSIFSMLIPLVNYHKKFNLKKDIYFRNSYLFSLFCMSVIIPFIGLHTISIALEQRYVSTIFPFFTALSLTATSFLLRYNSESKTTFQT